MKITSNNQILFFKDNEIVRFEDAPHSTQIHFFNGDVSEIKESITSIEKQLIDSDFIKIHGKHIVNVNCISCISNDPDDFIELNNGTVLPISAEQKEIILKLLSNHINTL